jgi:tRNA(fMet)-specific endonuclease VapC
MAIYVLDTDTVTWQQAGRRSILHRLEKLPQNAVFTTVITLREQVRGRLTAVDQAEERGALVEAYARLQITFDYFRQVNVLPFSLDALEHLHRLREQRVRIGTQDLRIAAISLSINGILVTSNRRDFDKVPGLAIEDWNLA